MIRSIRNKIRKSRGFTLVELMIVVAIVGILAALAIYGVSKYMKNAKTAEARNSVGQIAKDASAAYLREKMDGEVLGEGKTADFSNTLCEAAENKVPANLSDVGGKKYQPNGANTADYNVGTSKKGWKCLKFSMTTPQYYQYEYTSGTTDTFDAIANGDLDNDNEQSKFTLAGKVQSKVVTLAPAIAEEDADE